MKIEKMLQQCILHQLSVDQYILVYLVATEDFQTAKEYYKIGKISKRNIEDLAEKDIIISNFDFSQENLEITLEEVVVNPSFADSIIVNSVTASEEFLEHFYELVYVNNQFYPAKNMDEQEFEKAYKKYLKGDIDKHKLVIQALDYYVSKLPARGDMRIGAFALKKFVDGKYFDILISDYDNKGLTNDTQTVF